MQIQRSTVDVTQNHCVFIKEICIYSILYITRIIYVLYTQVCLVKPTVYRPLPDPRPNGKYNCKQNKKCTFNCDDGTFAGKMPYNPKTGGYTSETSWYHCCPDPSCQNGFAEHHSNTTETGSVCPASTCVQCATGYTLTDYGKCEVTIPSSYCYCENGTPFSDLYSHRVYK